MKIKSVLTIVFLLLGLCLVNNVTAQVSIGSTKDEVIAEFGNPTGVMSSGEEEILSYPGGLIVLNNGVVSDMDDNFKQRLNQRRKQDEFKKKQSKKGLVEHLGGWITKDKKQDIEDKAGKARYSQSDPVVIISNGGQSIKLQDLLVDGEITIIDFFADWCGPCRALSPYMERLAYDDSDVFLRKVDIVKWHTPIAKKYNINSIPDVRVFDRRGRMVGKPTHNFQEILSYVQRAK